MHNFRIFGNAIVLLNLLDLASTQIQTTTFVQAAPFLGYTLEGILILLLFFRDDPFDYLVKTPKKFLNHRIIKEMVCIFIIYLRKY